MKSKRSKEDEVSKAFVCRGVRDVFLVYPSRRAGAVGVCVVMENFVLIENVYWPKVTVYPDEPYRPEETDPVRRRMVAIADGLMAWANCMSGNKPPEGFGMGIVVLSKTAGGILGTVGSFSKAYDSLNLNAQ